jgi:predicted PurR-regulated permease PerM
MDLNAFWVIFALIVMTGLFGFTGIILGVPIFAVIYALIREFINNKYNEKIQRNNQNTNTTEQ